MHFWRAIVKVLFGSFAIQLICSISITVCAKSYRGCREYDGPGNSPLYLTPLIKCGKIKIAREASRVQNWTLVRSYSGFLTVNETYNSNMFFWFFPAFKDPENAPVVLWLQGGPGNPTFFGLFLEHGPFHFDNNKPGTVNYRNHPWAETHSMIYMDNPIGNGFSYTDTDDGYAKNMEDVSVNLYEGLIQFFTIYQEYRKNDFFVGGQSYGGKYVPAIAYHIHKKKERHSHWDSGVPINLKGIFIGSPVIDPRTQMKYADFLFNIGLIDEHQKEIVARQDERLGELIDQKKWEDAYSQFMETMLGGLQSYVYSVSGYYFKYNFLEPMDPNYASGYDVIAENWFRNSIHVGNLTFGDDGSVRFHLQEDIPKSTKYMVETLLNEDYKVLLYSAQLDIVVPAVSIENLILNMTNWNGLYTYLDSDRKIYMVGDQIAGFVKHAKNLIHVLIRKAGHNAPIDQPDWCFDMINRFTRGQSFD